jgi:hypothetical protein
VRERAALVERPCEQPSARRQCELLGVSRSAVYYEPLGETPLNLELRFPQFGGHEVSSLKRKRRGVSTAPPTKATRRGHVWTWDFIHDRTVRGGTLKMLTVVDECTRENHLIHVDRRHPRGRGAPATSAL